MYLYQNGVRNLWLRDNELLKDDPSEYWKLVKELKDEHNNDDPSNKISCDTWISHFTKLFSVKSQFQRLNTDFEKRLGDIEKDKSFTELG